MDGTVRVVRLAKSREWVARYLDGSHICRMVEQPALLPCRTKYLLESTYGNWEIGYKKRGRDIEAIRLEYPHLVAQIRFGIPDSDEIGSSLFDLFVDDIRFRRLGSGYQWRVKEGLKTLYSYQEHWNEAMRAGRICYELRLMEILPDMHRDLLLMAPLFWSDLLRLYDPADWT